MKKFKLLFSMLTILLMLCPAKTVYAEERTAEFKAGAEEGSITFRVWDMQTLEGKISVAAVDGGEIHLENVQITTNDEINTIYYGASGNKVFMLSNGTPVKSTITVELSFVEDGEYLVTLSGGCTDKKGKYNSSGLHEEKKIIVGSANVTEAEKEEESATSETANSNEAITSAVSSTDKTTTTTKEVEENTTIVRKEEKPKTEEETTEERVLDELLEEAEVTVKVKEDKKEKSKTDISGLWKILKIVLLALALIALCVGGYFLYRYHKKRNQDYDGAPMIDYNIEDDD